MTLQYNETTVIDEMIHNYKQGQPSSYIYW